MITAESIKTAGIVGAGTMGIGIAQVAATAGCEVILCDNDSRALEKAKMALQSTLQLLSDKGKMTPGEADALFLRIHFKSDLQAFQKCDIVIEAVVEDIEIKQQLFIKLEGYVRQECILATNTSSLSVTSIASVCARPSRVTGMHFFNPAPLMPLVEIIPGLATHPELATTCRQMIMNWKKIPVIAKDTPGFIVNRIARPFYGEAIRIYEEGIADFATIDWAMKERGGFKMGPFELMDMIGNDVNYTVTETVWKQFFYNSRYTPSLTQRRLYEARRFGKKRGIGYFDYSSGTVRPEPVRDLQLAEQIFMRILSMLINDAIDALYLNIATKEDIDLAMTKGVNYPKGLLKWADETGLKKILDQLKELHEEYGEDRYRPCVLLKRMVRENKRFY